MRFRGDTGIVRQAFMAAGFEDVGREIFNDKGVTGRRIKVDRATDMHDASYSSEPHVKKQWDTLRAELANAFGQRLLYTNFTPRSSWCRGEYASGWSFCIHLQN